MQAITRNCVAYICRKIPLEYAGFSTAFTNYFHTFRPIDSSLTTSRVLLQPNVPSLMQSCGMKVKGKLKLRCEHCYFVQRQGRMYVMCKSKPRHKQMALKKKESKFWILTHATQGPHGLFPKHREW